MKQHLKRIAAPRTWRIDRKTSTFTVRPKPSGHPMEAGMSLGVVLRDMLGYAGTFREARSLLQRQEVLVDGKRRFDPRYHLGLFDILQFPTLKKTYHLLYDAKGYLELKETDAKKICRVMGKTMLPKGKVQLHLHDGKNVLFDKDVKVGDSVVLDIKKMTITEVLPLKEGAQVYLTNGKHRGDFGVVEKLDGAKATYKRDGKSIETAKSYLFVGVNQ
jgi:small subunit ribosomal protein S4e